MNVKKLISRTAAPGAIALLALLTVACASTTVPPGLPSSIDQMNTGQASSPIRVGEGAAPAAGSPAYASAANAIATTDQNESVSATTP
jgi:hypothetical protein